MFKWFRPTALDPLSVSMAGVKLGDRVLVVGCGDPRLIAALAAKAGLSGRTCAVDESPDLATEAGRVALKEGALIETSVATPHALGFDRESFDLVVLRDVRHARSRVARAGRAGSIAAAASGRALHGDRHAGAQRRGRDARRTGTGKRRPTALEAIEVFKASGIRCRPHACRTRRPALRRSGQEEQLSSGTVTVECPRRFSARRSGDGRRRSRSSRR